MREASLNRSLASAVSAGESVQHHTYYKIQLVWEAGGNNGGVLGNVCTRLGIWIISRVKVIWHHQKVLRQNGSVKWYKQWRILITKRSEQQNASSLPLRKPQILHCSAIEKIYTSAAGTDLNLSYFGKVQ